jgi:hypothetical protein
MTENDLLKIGYKQALNYPELDYWKSYLKDLFLAKACNSSLGTKSAPKRKSIIPKPPKRARSKSCEFEAPFELSPRQKWPRLNRSYTLTGSSSSSCGDGEVEDRAVSSAGQCLGPITSFTSKMKSTYGESTSFASANGQDEESDSNTEQGEDRPNPSEVDNDDPFTCKTPRLFTVEEDVELLRLREKAMPMARWEQITQAFNSKFFPKTRSQVSLSHRYVRTIGPLATIRSGSSSRSARAVAIAYVDGPSRLGDIHQAPFATHTQQRISDGVSAVEDGSDDGDDEQ